MLFNQESSTSMFTKRRTCAASPHKPWPWQDSITVRSRFSVRHQSAASPDFVGTVVRVTDVLVQMINYPVINANCVVTIAHAEICSVEPGTIVVVDGIDLTPHHK